MWPTLTEGDVVLASGFLPVTPGSVVVADVENKEVIKRVHAISSDHVELLGDNSDYSRDSREFGLVHKSAIKGVVVGYPRTSDGHVHLLRSV